MFIFATEMLSFKPYDVSDYREVVGVIALGSIHVAGAYLDSWLDGVLRCCLAALTGEANCEIDLVEEGKMLQCRVERDNLLLVFGDQQVRLGSPRVAARTLVEDARSLLSQHHIANAILRGEIESTIDRIQATLKESRTQRDDH